MNIETQDALKGESELATPAASLQLVRQVQRRAREALHAGKPLPTVLSEVLIGFLVALPALPTALLLANKKQMRLVVGASLSTELTAALGAEQPLPQNPILLEGGRFIDIDAEQNTEIGSKAVAQELNREGFVATWQLPLLDGNWKHPMRGPGD